MGRILVPRYINTRTLPGLIARSIPFGPDNLLIRSVVRYHLQMTIDMKSLAREGAKAGSGNLKPRRINYSGHFRICVTAIALQRLRKTALVAGVKQMTAAERRSVSVRMKKYWAERRQKNDARKQARSSKRHPASARASPPRAERRLLRLRRNAGHNCGEKARPRRRSRAGAPPATVKQRGTPIHNTAFGAVSFCTVPIYSRLGEAVPGHV